MGDGQWAVGSGQSPEAATACAPIPVDTPHVNEVYLQST